MKYNITLSRREVILTHRGKIIFMNANIGHFDKRMTYIQQKHHRRNFLAYIPIMIHIIQLNWLEELVFV